jgi:hypothetical protein
LAANEAFDALREGKTIFDDGRALKSLGGKLEAGDNVRAVASLLTGGCIQ